MIAPPIFFRWTVGGSICWFSIVASLASAQDAVSRLKEYAVESVVFDLPHVLHFDLVCTTDSPERGRFESVRLIGRHVHISNKKFRNDFVEYHVSTLGSYREEKLFLQLSEDEKYSVLRDRETGEISGVMSSTRDSGDHAPIKYCNPFVFLIYGESELDRQTFQEDTMDRFLKVIQKVDESEQIVALKKKITAMQFTFSDEDYWRILKAKVLAASIVPEEIIKQEKTIEGLEDLKDYKVIFESAAKWRDIDGQHKIPFFVTSRKLLSSQRDPKRTIDFEGFFFGISLDVSPYEKLFNKERLNDADWRRDHDPELIEALSLKERKLYLK